MLLPFGLLLALCSVLFGYYFAGGEPRLLWQPYEFVIIAGSGIGSVIVSFPMKVCFKALRSIMALVHPSLPGKRASLEIVGLMFNLSKLLRAKGVSSIEKHIDAPEMSPIFQKAPFLLSDKRGLEVICDGLRLLTFGITQADVVEAAISKQISVYDEEERSSADFYLQLADALPAIGIIAAVLGVIIAMKHVGASPEILGGKIAAALVGTFLGIFLSYIIVAPVGHFLHSRATLRVRFFQLILKGVVLYLEGHAPVVIAELVRGSMADNVRPTFSQSEKYIQENSVKIS
ncbi:motility-associated protein [Candidatus Sneabacter namystus]|uniref:Flagellar motor stator protein MotA n=1 Tax=Candidatus Sneabacter namystus TaxID=2601646 RepID=A0A5C0UJF7_9RICK|nr:motility-associated protein [Candidatus Sneabacter namystus]QEK39602.1 flagellar motor stator protein MotA [Candidatus Sneabacter namystus]